MSGNEFEKFRPNHVTPTTERVKDQSSFGIWFGTVLRGLRDWRQGAGWGAFHQDSLYRQLMLELLEALNFTSFVETGTCRGYSTELIAIRKPRLPIQTIEVVPAYFELAKRVLAK